MIIKKIISASLCFLLALAPSGGALASGETAYNWYVVNNGEHRIPTLDAQQKIIEKHGGYYANTKVREGDRVIYLTFDAGYENGNVEKILNALKKHNAKGAFFILSNLMTRDPELVKRMLDEGHLICNHTKNHPDMTSITDRRMFARQLDSLAEEYKELTGSDMPKFYRPPEGRYSEQNLIYARDMGYKTVFWSFAYADWDNDRQPDPAKALEKILAHTHNGEIMLLHPTSATNAAIMDELLTRLEADGYRFGSLEELGG